MAVKKAVQCGNVEDAIEKVNDLNPEVRNLFVVYVYNKPVVGLHVYDTYIIYPKAVSQFNSFKDFSSSHGVNR